MRVTIMGIKSITKKDGTPSKFVFFCREPLNREKSTVDGLVTDSFYLNTGELTMLPANCKPGCEAELLYEYDGFRTILSSIEVIGE